MVRLKDIAARAGVSLMTVSKALRDAPDISSATKTRIKLLADQMGYVPDSAAQNLRNRNSKLFGLVIPSVANPVYVRVAAAVEERARELGYDLMLSHSLNLVEREESGIRRFLSRRVDGIFIAPVYRMAPTAPAYEELKRRNIPTVILGHRAPFCQTFANVESDDVSGSFAITSHLLELGHKRIAFFCGPSAAPWAQERLEGYRRALRHAQLEIDDRLIFAAGATVDEGEKAALQLIDESVKVTAVQAVNDLVAIGAANLFLNQGIKIPQDLSLAGFGNIFTSQFFRVPLTTASHPKYRLGEAAVESMLQLLQGQPAETRRLQANIVIRESTAPLLPMRVARAANAPSVQTKLQS